MTKPSARRDRSGLRPSAWFARVQTRDLDVFTTVGWRPSMTRYSPPTFRVLRPTNVRACLDLLERLQADEWIFRGQRSATWKLETTLERQARKDGKTAIEKEKETLDSFFAEIIPSTSIFGPQAASRSFREQFDIIYIFSLLQHYFSCTRLLDFTEDHKIGIYFAIREAKNIITLHDRYRSERDKKLLYQYQHEPSSIWCLDEKAINESGNKFCQEVVLRLPMSEENKGIANSLLDKNFRKGLSGERGQTASESDAYAESWYRKTINTVLLESIHNSQALITADLSKFDITPMIFSIRLPEPPVLNQRIGYQKGLFLAPYNIVKNSLHGSEGKVTLFEANLCSSLPIPANALIDPSYEEEYTQRMAIDQTQAIKVILTPNLLDELIEYIIDLDDRSLGLQS